eukprot:g36862.t1
MAGPRRRGPAARVLPAGAAAAQQPGPAQPVGGARRPRWPLCGLLGAVLLLLLLLAHCTPVAPRPGQQRAKVLVQEDHPTLGRVAVAEDRRAGWRVMLGEDSVLGGRWLSDGSSIFTSNVNLIAAASLDLEMASAGGPPSFLLLGLGTGDVAAALVARRYLFDAVELHPAVVSLAERFFGLQSAAGGGQVFVEDAFAFVQRQAAALTAGAAGAAGRGGPAKRYHVIMQDVFDAKAASPLYTSEHFARVRRLLTAQQHAQETAQQGAHAEGVFVLNTVVANPFAVHAHTGLPLSPPCLVRPALTWLARSLLLSLTHAFGPDATVRVFLDQALPGGGKGWVPQDLRLCEPTRPNASWELANLVFYASTAPQIRFSLPDAIAAATSPPGAAAHALEAAPFLNSFLQREVTGLFLERAPRPGEASSGEQPASELAAGQLSAIQDAFEAVLGKYRARRALLFPSLAHLFPSSSGSSSSLLPWRRERTLHLAELFSAHRSSFFLKGLVLCFFVLRSSFFFHVDPSIRNVSLCGSAIPVLFPPLLSTYCFN